MPNYPFIWNFYSHAPYGTWQNRLRTLIEQYHFYSHAPYGTWLLGWRFWFLFWYFYSHAPYGTWPILSFVFVNYFLFLLTRPLRDVTFQNHLLLALTNISTHTPLTGRDKLIRFLWSVTLNFYSHAPYGTWQKVVIISAVSVYFYSHAPYGTWHWPISSVIPVW